MLAAIVFPLRGHIGYTFYLRSGTTNTYTENLRTRKMNTEYLLWFLTHWCSCRPALNIKPAPMAYQQDQLQITNITVIDIQCWKKYRDRDTHIQSVEKLVQIVQKLASDP